LRTARRFERRSSFDNDIRTENAALLTHDMIERKQSLLIVLVILVVAVGGLVEIVPLYFQRSVTEPVAGLKPYGALQLTGRDIYVREGCYNCHSQMVRFVYDRPFQWGSKRTGPDLHRVGGRYSDEWHRLHLKDPRSLVPESNMPAYAWLERAPANAADIAAKMHALRVLGVPYGDEEIAQAPEALKGRTEMDALIAYLQVLGTALRQKH
jgi:cytochrome c oxidase cbb3-type subunit 2